MSNPNSYDQDPTLGGVLGPVPGHGVIGMQGERLKGGAEVPAPTVAEVVKRSDEMVARYIGRIDRQKETIDRLLAEKAILEDERDSLLLRVERHALECAHWSE